MTSYNPWLILFVGATGLAVGFILTAASDRKPTQIAVDPAEQAKWDAWVDEALQMAKASDEATIAHIAKHEADNIAREWAELNGGAS